MVVGGYSVRAGDLPLIKVIKNIHSATILPFFFPGLHLHHC